MKVFVSGASAERTMIKTFMEQLRANGVEITHDWVADMEAEAEKGVADSELTVKQRHFYSNRDVAGVLSARVFWMVIPSNASVGAWFEFGLACGAGIMTVTSGDDSKSIFTAQANVHFPTHEAALAALIEKRQRMVESPLHFGGAGGND